MRDWPKRVAFVPGGAFHPDGSGANTLRLSYLPPTIERIDEGIARLAVWVSSQRR